MLKGYAPDNFGERGVSVGVEGEASPKRGYWTGGAFLNLYAPFKPGSGWPGGGAGLKGDLLYFRLDSCPPPYSPSSYPCASPYVLLTPYFDLDSPFLKLSSYFPIYAPYVSVEWRERWRDTVYTYLAFGYPDFAVTVRPLSFLSITVDVGDVVRTFIDQDFPSLMLTLKGDRVRANFRLVKGTTGRRGPFAFGLSVSYRLGGRRVRIEEVSALYP